MRYPTELYVELHGPDEEQTERLASMVRGIVRGMGLAYRNSSDEAAGYWPGGCAGFVMDPYGTHVRLASCWPRHNLATMAGRTLRDYLLANAWGEELGAMWVSTTFGEATNRTVIHGDDIPAYGALTGEEAR